jgi:hypothetical protein
MTRDGAGDGILVVLLCFLLSEKYQPTLVFNPPTIKMKRLIQYSRRSIKLKYERPLSWISSAVLISSLAKIDMASLAMVFIIIRLMETKGATLVLSHA